MSELYDIFRRHPRISTDTRRIEPGSVFFALHGATFDGNRFAADALSKGAAYAVVDDPAAVSGDRTVLVGDTLEALQELAREYRRELAIPILAISGSNGKTTTKELVSRVLAERFEVYATPNPTTASRPTSAARTSKDSAARRAFAAARASCWTIWPRTAAAPSSRAKTKR